MCLILQLEGFRVEGHPRGVGSPPRVLHQWGRPAGEHQPLAALLLLLLRLLPRDPHYRWLLLLLYVSSEALEVAGEIGAAFRERQRGRSPHLEKRAAI